MDSVAVNADIEIGGVDQLYAFQAARTLQGNDSGDPESLVLMPLLRGLDGNKKMSKSLGNYVGLTDSPKNMFGKIMSIPDTLIEEYLHLASTFSRTEVASMIQEMSDGRNPMDIKIALAHNITHIYHSEDDADRALEYFNNQFRSKSDDIEYSLTLIENVDNPIELILALGAAKTRSEARRLIEQGGVAINGKKINDLSEKIDSIDGLKVKVGKKRFFQVKLKT
jgi:tyrosyl-tRNA synthetase